MFAGGFDLPAAAAVAGAGGLDEYAVLDLLDALVRKSLVTADRSTSHTRYGLLETIRQFAEDQLATTGNADDTRDAHARYFAGQETPVLTLWNSSRQREAYDWLDVELANLRTGFRWAADRGDLDTAAAIATYTAFLGWFVAQFEPVAWVEELLEPARAAAHRRLAALSVMACLCCYVGRVDDGVRHADVTVALIGDVRYAPAPFGYAGFWAGVAHLNIGRPDIATELFQSDVDRTGDPLVLARSFVVAGSALSGRVEEAMGKAGDVVTAAEATTNPASLAWAVCSYGMVFRVGDPPLAMHALRRGMAVARDSGNSFIQAGSAALLAGLEAEHGDQQMGLELFTRAISGFHDAGDTSSTRSPMAALAVFLDQIGRHEPAAIIAGYAHNRATRTTYPELVSVAEHLLGVLGPDRYTTLTDQGRAMAPADAVRYALEQIDLARGTL